MEIERDLGAFRPLVLGANWGTTQNLRVLGAALLKLLSTHNPLQPEILNQTIEAHGQLRKLCADNGRLL